MLDLFELLLAICLLVVTWELEPPPSRDAGWAPPTDHRDDEVHGPRIAR